MTPPFAVHSSVSQVPSPDGPSRSAEDDRFATWAEDEAGQVQGAKPPSVRWGRYRLLEGIGAGGMGEVYRAYDPELDREIALKRVGLGRDDEEARSRLLREGQTIARLSHPNIVQIHDVGTAGETGDLFIAMELVEGTTLRGWLRQQDRHWREVAEVFRQAGEGLAAAHARGIVHRDFKPDNVLVTPEGVAKVVDFGLADHVDAMSMPTGPIGSPTASSPAAGQGTTDDGSGPPRLGTPAYMPPEQHAGVASDPRVDQFSFAVALYEALVGRLPFAGSNTAAYVVSVLDGAVRAFPKDTQVPKRLQRAILRALSVSPDDRFDDLRPLLQELGRDPRTIRRRRLAMAAAVAVGGVLSIGVGELTRDAPADGFAACDQAARAIDGVWSDDARQGLRTAIASVGSVYAEETASRASAALDELAHRWATARRGACRMAVETGAETTAEPDRPALAGRYAAVQQLCLERNLARQRDLIEALSSPAPSMLEHAVDAIDRVVDELERCGAPAYLEQMTTEESLPEQQRREIVAALGLARQHLDLRETAEGIRTLEALGDADARERWPAALLLQWTEIRAALERVRGDFHRARSILEDGAFASLGGDAPLAAAGWSIEYGDVLYALDEIDAMDRPYRRAHAIFERRLGREASDTIMAAAAAGHRPFAKGDYEAALAIYEAAAETASRLGQKAADQRAIVREWQADALAAQGRFDEARAHIGAVVEARRRRRGPHHPATIEALVTMGTVQLRAGAATDALATLREALALADAVTDTHDSIDRATILANIGGALTYLERYDEAAQTLQDALDVMARKGLPSDHGKVLATRANLALVSSERGRHDEAIAALEPVLSAMEDDGTDATANGVMVRHNLAGAMLDAGRLADALDVLKPGIADAHAHRDAILEGRLRVRLAQVLDAQGRRQAGERELEAARASFATHPDGQIWQDSLDRYAAGR